MINSDLLPILKPYILYESSTGTSVNVTLSDNVENYNEVEIISELGSVKIIPNIIANATISNSVYYDVLYVNYIHFDISKKSISNINSGSYYLGANHSCPNKIYKVIGYK